jgi:hypothetical protein
VIPVKSTNGRQLFLVDAPQKMQGDTRPFLRPVGITHTATHRKWHQRTWFRKFGGVFREVLGGKSRHSGIACVSRNDRQDACPTNPYPGSDCAPAALPRSTMIFSIIVLSLFQELSSYPQKYFV